MTLTDAMTDYIDGALPQDAGTQQRVRCQRAFMAGALEALQRVNHGADRAELLREVIGYGRTVGRDVEAAR